jgi:hypothetical protein
VVSAALIWPKLKNLSLVTKDSDVSTTIPSPTPEIITQYPMMKGIESKYFFDRALPKAQTWAANASICYFRSSVQKMDDLTPDVEYRFCSIDKEKIFKYSHPSVRVEKTSTINNSYSLEGKIEPWPPAVSAEEAIDLAIKEFTSQKTDEQIVTSFGITLKPDEPWSIHLKVKTAADSFFVPCSVYFNREVYCQSITAKPITLEELFKFYQNAETLYLDSAWKAAKNWSEQAQLRRFYFSISNLSDTQPYINYQFFDDEQDEIFSYTQSNTLYRPETELKALGKYDEKVVLENFPPNLRMIEAVKLAVAEFEKDKLAEQELSSFSISIEEDKREWSINISAVSKNAETDKKEYQYYYYYVDFAGQIKKLKL